jgi:hypothetical protein
VKKTSLSDKQAKAKRKAAKKKGKSGILIKPQNKGKFTAYKKRTGTTTSQALHSKNPKVRKMANFARNAAKWHHGGKK